MNANTTYIADYLGISKDAALVVQEVIDNGDMIDWSEASWTRIDRTILAVASQQVFSRGAWIARLALLKEIN